MDREEIRFKQLELSLKLLAAAGAIVAFFISFGQWLDARRTALGRSNRPSKNRSSNIRKNISGRCSTGKLLYTSRLLIQQLLLQALLIPFSGESC